MKRERQAAICDIVNSKKARTQEDITRLLSEAGYNVTQATVSRDLKELGFIKCPAKDGAGQEYSSKAQTLVIDIEQLEKIGLKAIEGVRCASNIVVIKTTSSHAGPVAKGLDELELVSVLGCVAGDDTIIVVMTDVGAAAALCNTVSYAIENKNKA